MLTRRHVLEFLAATPPLAAGALALGAVSSVGLAACAPSHLPDPIAAWRNPGAGETDPRRFTLAHAILAPNPHNMQPWRVDLEGDDTIVLTIDPARLIPVTDPRNRQITVGCGAFLELLDLAARESGHRADIVVFPEGEPQPVLDARPIARIALKKDPKVARDPLYTQITARRTNRQPFDPARIPSDDDLRSVVSAPLHLPSADDGLALTVDAARDAATVARMRDLAFGGWVREMATPAANRESVNVMRIGAAEIARHRDGLVLEGPAVEIMHAVGLLSRKALLDQDSMASKQGAALWKKLADTAPAFVWIRGGDNTRATQIAAGRAYARLNLAAAARGLGIHPWSMALEEYAEMADLYAAQQALLGASAAAPVQMLARIGYARTVHPSPRRGLDDLMSP